MKDFEGGLVERSWQGQNLRTGMEATEIEPLQSNLNHSITLDLTNCVGSFSAQGVARLSYRLLPSFPTFSPKLLLDS